jgi:hypothetical protein
MRPRAVLHATAICLLLAAATVRAAPPGLIPQTARGQKAASTAKKPALAGSLSERAESRLKALSALPGSLGERPESPLKKPSALPGSLGERPESPLKKPSALPGSLGERPESPLKKPSALPGSRAERPESRFKTLEQTAALKQRAGLERLLKEVPDPQLKPLSKILLHKTGFSGFSIVDGAVKQFSTDFQAGAKNPDRYMSEVSLSQPALVEKWNNTPQDKRIFVIGAGKDSAKVSELTESLKSDGYTVFFYKFCRQSSGALCRSQAVGAMCGTSGITMVYQTPAAELSEYVKVEAATAGFIEGLNDKVVLISTSELFAAKFAMYVANMPTPTPSAIK